MPDNSDITVVITCFNYGRFLPEAVASACDQTSGRPRVVVIDDGSDDPLTIAVLERLPEDVVVVRQKNGGVSAARNAGLALAQTPFVLVLDADDRLAPGALDAMRAPLEADATLGFSYGRIRFIGDWSGILHLPQYDPYALLYRHIVGLTALIRRPVIDEIGGYDPDFRYYEDWEFWLRALRHGWRGRRIDTITVEYRKHGASKWSADRSRYRRTFAQLRTRHAELYARAPQLAAESDLGPVRRLVYRHLWGPRPWPPILEALAYRLLWRRPAR